jgi:hypothetical protein
MYSRVLPTLLTLSGRPFEMMIYACRSDAAAWLSRQPGAPPAARLQALMRELEPRRVALSRFLLA